VRQSVEHNVSLQISAKTDYLVTSAMHTAAWRNLSTDRSLSRDEPTDPWCMDAKASHTNAALILKCVL
jgi:hypothetical protein